MRKTILLLALLALSAVRLCAQMFVPLAGASLLSSESVFSLYQDSNGQMWAGTYDGLNILEGSACRTIPSGTEGSMVSGSQIETIQAGNGPDAPEPCKDARYVWVRSNWGFDRYDKLTGLFEHHNEFHGAYRTAVKGATVIVQRLNGDLYYYNWDSHRFTPLGLRVAYEDTKAFFFTDEKHVEIIMTDRVAHVALALAATASSWGSGAIGRLASAMCGTPRHVGSGPSSWMAITASTNGTAARHAPACSTPSRPP